jgi:hypothetical protein
MSSGDTVLTAADLTVNASAVGLRTGWPHFIGQSGASWRLALGGGFNSGELQVDFVFQSSAALPGTTPFDPTKTYDIIIKEH